MTQDARYVSLADFQGFPRNEVKIAVPKVEIYTRWGCGYCVTAKALLDRKGVKYTEYDLTMGGNQRAEMLVRVPGAATLPQILIDGKPVGGSDDIHALDRQGKLDTLLGIAC
jgi:glutaredoxin 3